MQVLPWEMGNGPEKTRQVSKMFSLLILVVTDMHFLLGLLVFSQTKNATKLAHFLVACSTTEVQVVALMISMSF
jgi:hypothetical protein